MIGFSVAAVCAVQPVAAAWNTGETKFITQLRMKADAGNADAQYELGNSYYVGVGIAKNYGEAARWFSKAANAGNAQAQSALGNMYLSGYGVPKDIGEALMWWRKAAEQHHPDALDQLGFAYLLGDGVPKDYIKAYMWFNLAASHGDKHAIKDRDSVAKYMSAEMVAEAQRRQSEWTQQHP